MEVTPAQKAVLDRLARDGSVRNNDGVPLMTARALHNTGLAELEFLPVRDGARQWELRQVLAVSVTERTRT